MRSVAIAVQARKPVILVGKPGVGKTSWTNALGRTLDEPVVTVIASLREPSDFGGLPRLTETGVELLPPKWAYVLRDAERAILFLDEITTAPPAVQAALLRVVLERVVGECELGPNVAIIAAANPPEEAAGGWELAPPLANRLVWFGWRSDPRLWAEGEMAGWPDPVVPKLPLTWREHIPHNRALVCGYIHTRPDKLLVMPDETAKRSGPWPSPRTWSTSIELLAATDAVGGSIDDKMELVSGCIGHGAIEFMAYLREANLPRPADIISDPTGWEIPKGRGDLVFAILGSTVAYVLNEVAQPGVKNKKKEKQKLMDAAWRALGYVHGAGFKDAAAVPARTLCKGMPDDLDMSVIHKEVNKFKELLDLAKIMASR